jgi:hypothetical protein
VKFFKQNHVKFGLLGTLILIGFLLLLHLSGTESLVQYAEGWQKILLFLSPILLWYFGIRAKKKEMHGKLSFKHAVQEGYKIAWVFGVISPFAFLLYYLIFNFGVVIGTQNPDQMTTSTTHLVILIYMLIQFITCVIFGTLYGVIASAILAAKKKS